MGKHHSKLGSGLSAIVLTLAAAVVLAEPEAGAVPEAAALFATHCASCHGVDRLGGTGPALLPENLGRLKPEAAVEVITKGRPATQMLGFADKLSGEEIKALADFVFKPLAAVPVWGMEQISASRVVHVDPAKIADKPVYDADPLNLFVVVEVGDHHATILDGDRLEPLKRVPTRYALHGGPKYSPTGRFVYFASRDGWISKFDMYGLETLVEVRAGINTRNLAASADGRYLMAANYLPHSLVLLDADDLKPIQVIEARDEQGKSSRVSAVYTAAPRQSFIAALKDAPEIWEIGYGDHPLPVYQGPMHDYRLGEGLAQQPERFPIRRIRVEDYLDDFFLSQDYRLLIGASRDGASGQVIQLDVGRKIAAVAIDGLPHLASGISFESQGQRVLATPHLKKSEVSVIDLKDFKVIKQIPTLGPGFFMRSHENTPYAWTDVSLGKEKDAIHVIDKGRLEIVKTLKPAPGQTAAHVEFDRYGKYALVSVWEMDGALVVYDAATLEEIKRLPMRKPSGKYNVYNKIHLSEGTSH